MDSLLSCVKMLGGDEIHRADFDAYVRAGIDWVPYVVVEKFAH